MKYKIVIINTYTIHHIIVAENIELYSFLGKFYDNRQFNNLIIMNNSSLFCLF